MISRRWLKWTLIGVLGSLAMSTLFLVIKRELVLRQGDREVAGAVAETEAMDPNWEWEKLNSIRKKVSAEQNGATLIPQIKAVTPTDWDKRWNELTAANETELPANVRLPSPVREKAQGILTNSSESLRLARTLKDRPQGFREYRLAHNPLDTLLPDVQFTRDVANLLKWSAYVAMEDGDYSQIADDLVAALNASRSIGDEPFLISQLVRMATRNVMVRSMERVLAQTTQPEQLASLRLPALQEALAQDMEEPLLLFGIRGDRAISQVLYQRLGDGTVHLGEIAAHQGAPQSFTEKLGWWVYRGRFPSDRAFCLRWFNEAIRMAELPIHEQPAAFEELTPITDDENILAKLLLAVNKVAEAQWRSVAEARCAVAGIACERFRLKRDRWPTTLTELCPEFLAEVPLDPFDGQPLRFAKQDDGVIVHSVGRIPLSRASPSRHIGLPDGIEIGFRLWNPDARRQPPPPERPAASDEDMP
jgi:hypothetical protein